MIQKSQKLSDTVMSDEDGQKYLWWIFHVDRFLPYLFKMKVVLFFFSNFARSHNLYKREPNFEKKKKNQYKIAFLLSRKSLNGGLHQKAIKNPLRFPSSLNWSIHKNFESKKKFFQKRDRKLASTLTNYSSSDKNTPKNKKHVRTKRKKRDF